MRVPSILLASAALLAACGGGTAGGTVSQTPCPVGSHVVRVGQGGTNYSPSALTGVHPGETVCWQFTAGGHDVMSGSTCTPDGAFSSGGQVPQGQIYTRTFPTAGTFPYFCSFHCALGMTGTVTVAP